MASVRREGRAVARDVSIPSLETNAAKVVELCVFFNGPFVERVSHDGGSMRKSRFNESGFVNLAAAQRTIEAWRMEYNEARPHTGLARRTPAEFAETYLLLTPSTHSDRQE